MKKKDFTPEFWQYVMDSCSLINIDRDVGIRGLEKRKGMILIPEKVAYEVAYDPRIGKTDRLRKFILQNSKLVIEFQNGEEDEYLRILKQPGIHDGEAAAMVIALTRNLPLVIDERETKATGKAKNHGIETLKWQDFLKKGY